MKNIYGFETNAIHGGFEPDSVSRASNVPVHRSSSYVFDSTAYAADLFSGKRPGNIYSRIMNPTQDALEKRVAVLEGGRAALALASGTSAIFYSIINICTVGDEIIAASNLYGGSHTMFTSILPGLGITTKFVDYDDYDGYRNLINDKTKAIFIETIGNPHLGVADVEKIASVAAEFKIPLIVDSTFTTPFLMRPIEYGANIVIHSLTKWMGGQGAGIGGVVVDAGTFDWNDPRFPSYSEPDRSFHGMVFGRDLREDNDIAFIVRMRNVALRNTGACISPDNAWLFLKGLETLHLRMERHCENAAKVAEYLNSHRSVSWVRYPGLSGDRDHQTAARLMKRGFGGMVVFELEGGFDSGVKFIDSLSMITHLANVGDVKSLVIHPASTTHSQMSSEERAAAGISPGLIRLSVGIENVEDIIADIDRALIR